MLTIPVEEVTYTVAWRNHSFIFKNQKTILIIKTIKDAVMTVAAQTHLVHKEKWLPYKPAAARAASPDYTNGC